MSESYRKYDNNRFWATTRDGLPLSRECRPVIQNPFVSVIPYVRGSPTLPEISPVFPGVVASTS
jgi:hypothetical protein